MNSSKVFTHARTLSCLALALTFLTAAAVPQELQPKVLKKVVPAYPDILKKMNVSGSVRVEVTINPDGSVKDVENRGGNAIFVDSVASAVHNWKYAPADHQRTAEVSVTFICCSTVLTKP
ncbi:MAG: energy transducer TonB [Acidobacteria bacterium]|nr:energy transducer TonB [Acidobacteriota bacterium]